MQHAKTTLPSQAASHEDHDKNSDCNSTVVKKCTFWSDVEQPKFSKWNLGNYFHNKFNFRSYFLTDSPGLSKMINLRQVNSFLSSLKFRNFLTSSETCSAMSRNPSWSRTVTFTTWPVTYTWCIISHCQTCHIKRFPEAVSRLLKFLWQ